MPFLLAAYAFALGAVVGSFLNVVIHRYPREESIVFPASHCPRCNTPIRLYDNVPILSYIILGGRCRSCREPISPRYPLVELANALFYLAVYQRTGTTFGFVPVAAAISMTIALIFIDAEIQILPDVIDLPGVAVGLVIGWRALGACYPSLTLASNLRQSIIGAAAGSGVLLAIALAYKLVRRIEGMGLGDVKMMAMLGAILGWAPLLPLMVIASATGAVVGVLVALRSERGMRVPIPFGVFLGFAFLVILFFGHTFLALMGMEFSPAALTLFG